MGLTRIYRYGLVLWSKIAVITRTLLARYRDGHEVEHRMFACLEESLWLAQGNNTLPDEQAYLACLQKLAR